MPRQKHGNHRFPKLVLGVMASLALAGCGAHEAEDARPSLPSSEITFTQTFTNADPASNWLIVWAEFEEPFYQRVNFEGRFQVPEASSYFFYTRDQFQYDPEIQAFAFTVGTPGNEVVPMEDALEREEFRVERDGEGNATFHPGDWTFAGYGVAGEGRGVLVFCPPAIRATIRVTLMASHAPGLVRVLEGTGAPMVMPDAYEPSPGKPEEVSVALSSAGPVLGVLMPETNKTRDGTIRIDGSSDDFRYEMVDGSWENAKIGRRVRALGFWGDGGEWRVSITFPSTFDPIGDNVPRIVWVEHPELSQLWDLR